MALSYAFLLLTGHPAIKKPSVNSEIGDLRNKVAASALHFLQYFGTVGWTWKSTCPIKIEWWGVGMVVCLKWGAGCLHIIWPVPRLSQNSTLFCLEERVEWVLFCPTCSWVSIMLVVSGLQFYCHIVSAGVICSWFWSISVVLCWWRCSSVTPSQSAVSSSCPTPSHSSVSARLFLCGISWHQNPGILCHMQLSEYYARP